MLKIVTVCSRKKAELIVRTITSAVNWPISGKILLAKSTSKP